MKQIIECVPNFSEGRNREVIDKIVSAMAAVEMDGERVKVLDVDPGQATNRTVVTFVGTPTVVLEAALAGARTAKELIDMREHHGAHPRSGALDVCPLIPVANISLEECATLARALAKRMWEEEGIPCYCYEAAAFTPERKNLAVCREGEYEALPEKMNDEKRRPDFGPAAFDENVAKVGATNVGARNFLIAVNFNLNTTSTRRAMAVAFDVREKGRKARENNSLTGKVLKDEQGNEIWIPGTLKGTKAIGWFIDEYGIAQVSMNITDIDATPLHIAFEEVSRAAAARGMRVTGAEIVGLVPKSVLIDAGKFYLARQQRSLGIEEKEIIKIAVKSMGLDELKPFDPKEKVIEYMMVDEAEQAAKEHLIRMTCKDFANETASESAAPGGGLLLGPSRDGDRSCPAVPFLWREPVVEPSGPSIDRLLQRPAGEMEAGHLLLPLLPGASGRHSADCLGYIISRRLPEGQPPHIIPFRSGRPRRARPWGRRCTLWA